MFTRRSISVTVTGPETIVLTDHRVTARIVSVGDPNIGSAELQIYGMTSDRMNQLTTFGRAFMTPNYNYQIIISAGDAVNGMNTIFHGTIQQAWADYSGMPDVPFHILAFAAPTVQSDPQQNWNSYKGPTDVGQMMSGLAGKMGMQLENTGVNLKLVNPYHFGSYFRQAQLIREAADINMLAENNVLAIWPRNQVRQGAGPVISLDTGMVTAPSFTDYGVIVKQEFSTPVKYGVNMTINSRVVPKANGPWSIKQVDYDLAANMPNGHWFVTLWGSKPDQLILQPLQF